MIQDSGFCCGSGFQPRSALVIANYIAAGSRSHNFIKFNQIFLRALSCFKLVLATLLNPGVVFIQKSDPGSNEGPSMFQSFSNTIIFCKLTLCKMNESRFSA